jgi:hypothetical protein
VTLGLNFAGPGKCGALYVFDSAYGLNPSPLICTRKPGHEGDHEDETQQNPLHDGPPHWSEEMP